MGAYVVSPRQTVPLFLSISRTGVGGVAGLSPTVEVRRSSDGFYLDFSDNTFKAAGWTLRKAPMTDLSGGAYQRLLNLGLIGTQVLDVLVAFYEVTGPNASVANDVFNVENLELMRQVVENRIEESPSPAPNTNGNLVLYDDDGTTPLRTWPLRDFTGGATLGATGAPSRRGPAA